MTNTLNNLVQINSNNTIVTTSTIVANTFDKRHDHVLRDIKTLISSLDEMDDATLATTPFKENKYINQQNGQQYTEYELNRDGFTLLAMGYTGKEALKFKINYIKAFNTMEEQIKLQFTKTKVENNDAFIRPFRLEIDELMYGRISSIVFKIGGVNRVSLASQVQRTTLWNILKYRTKTISSMDLKAICRVTGMSEDWLFYGKGKMYDVTPPQRELQLAQTPPAPQVLEQKKSEQTVPFKLLPHQNDTFIIECGTNKFANNTNTIRFKSGDHLIVEKCRSFQGSGIYIFHAKNNESLYDLKYMQIDSYNGELNLLMYDDGDNYNGKKVPFDTIANGVTIVGKVLGAQIKV